MLLRFPLFLLCVLFLISTLSANGQRGRFLDEYTEPMQKKVGIEANAYIGSVFKHSPDFKPDINGPTVMLEVGAVKHTTGDKPWSRLLNYPEVGGSFIYTRFGNTTEMGQAFSLMPHVKFFIRHRGFLDMYFRVGFGISWITKPYNRFDNPGNNAIGSHLNNISQLKFGMNWKLKPGLELATGIALTHFSNGAFNKPNLGLNNISASVGINYYLGDKEQEGSYDRSLVPKPEERNGIMLKFSLAFNERHTDGGPLYPVYITTMQYSYATSKVNYLNAGFIYSVDIGTWEELIDRQIDEDKSQKASATELSFYVGDEILIGKVGIYGLMGVYLLRPKFVPSRVFTKWGANIYWYSLPSRPSMRFFTGVSVKAHNFVAQYLEFSAGVTF
jgi:hypothetical protein